MARVHFASAARLAMVGYAFVRAFPALGGICLPLFFSMGIPTPDFSSHLQRIYCNLALWLGVSIPALTGMRARSYRPDAAPCIFCERHAILYRFQASALKAPLYRRGSQAPALLPLPVLRGTAAAGARLPAGTARISRLPPLRGAPPCPAACVQTSPWIFRPPGFSPAAFRVTIFIILFIYIFFIEKGRMFHGASDSIGRR